MESLTYHAYVQSFHSNLIVYFYLVFRHNTFKGHSERLTQYNTQATCRVFCWDLCTWAPVKTQVEDDRMPKATT